MRLRLSKPVRVVGYSSTLLVLGVAAIVAAPHLRNRLVDPPAAPSAAETPPVELSAGQSDTLDLEPAVAERMQIRTAPAEATSQPTPLELSGTLILDANRVAHIHPRFAGEVVQVGSREGEPQSADFGAGVRQGQLLAVLWSREVGEKKSELVDNLSQLDLDREVFRRLSESSMAGAVPERTLREAQRKVESDEIAVARVERTLQTWRISEEELAAVRAEADRLRKEGKRSHEELVHQWAKVEVRAPLDGVIMERNVTLGDLVDTSADLFVLADLKRLRVMVNAYEESLPSLDRLSGEQRQWSVAVPADPSIRPHSGGFDQIGPIIDPNQHSALVLGWVDNAEGRLRVGQFVTATVNLPPPTEEVAIPTTALVEQGNRQLVFVQPDPSRPEFTRRRVAVVRRMGETVLVVSKPSPAQRGEGIEPLAADERVVVSGAVQLTESLTNLQAMAVAGR